MFKVKCPFYINKGAHIYACAQSYSIDYSGGASFYIPTDQHGVIQNSMPMVSLPIEVAAGINSNVETPAGLASFVNLGAVIKYNVYTSDTAYGAEQIQSITFEATSPIAGDFDVDLPTVSETSIPSPSGLTEKCVTSFLDTPEEAGIDKANGLKVYQVVAPGTLSGTVTVTTDAAVYSYSVSNIEFERASIKTLNVNLASTNATRRTLADFETLLTACEWQLVSVAASDGTDITQNAGDALTFNADHTLSLTCNTPDQVYNYNTDEWVDYRLGYSSWDDVTREWSLSGFYGAYPQLNFTSYAYPLAIVTDNTYAQEYNIVSLTNATLVLDYQSLFTITFTNPATPAPTTPEALLTAHEWELTSVLRKGQYDTEFYDYTETAGNKMTLNADHSFAFDCTANNGYVFDYHNGWGEIHSDLSDWGGFWTDPNTVLEWSYSESGGTNYLAFTECAYPLVIIDEIITSPQSYEIAVLTDSYLELHHHNAEPNANGCIFDYIITFTIPGEKSRVEGLLTAHNWELTSVTRDGADVTETAGNSMTLNADHSFSFNCSAHNGLTAYYPGYPNCVTDPSYDLGYSWATYEWSVSFGAVTSLAFTQYSYPLVVVDSDYSNKALSYEIATLDDSTLVLEYNHSTDGLYRITYTAK